jgi:hypothetical protein
MDAGWWYSLAFLIETRSVSEDGTNCLAHASGYDVFACRVSFRQTVPLPDAAYRNTVRLMAQPLRCAARLAFGSGRMMRRKSICLFRLRCDSSGPALSAVRAVDRKNLPSGGPLVILRW